MAKPTRQVQFQLSLPSVLVGFVSATVMATAIYALAPAPLKSLAAALIPGDINEDNRVDIYDLSILLGNWGRAVTPSPSPSPTSPPQSGIWKPALNTSWQWQLTGTIDQTVDAQMFDIDGFDQSAATVASLKSKGKRVVCYFSAGSWEDWRPDAAQFPAAVKGSSNGWPGERWLDIRNLSALKPIMDARIKMCKDKGFDAVEPDNIDGYTNNTGFPLTAANQIAYNKYLADAAHAQGMSIALKNDIDQVSQLLPYYDFAINEQCFQYGECNTLLPFIAAGKAVFNVEYSLNTTQFCPQANSMNFNSLKKDLNLSATRTACR